MSENRQESPDTNKPSFNADAKRSRLSYLVITILILTGMALTAFVVPYLYGLIGDNPITFILTLLLWGVRIFLLFILFIVTNQRLNDIGWHGAWSILVIVPLLSLLFLVVLFIKPTKVTEENT
ncbi:DUF805 domain-containing protein [Oceanospirillaceae bacterium]|jgi:uncharacterized membrane protein YhaH (DUF805 family)|nr:DUF805 domain-containing protein [Oceanospirillaceae bacterium]|tara:strand:+ start:334 stop:702 length:369 start_codon:yes stop_codon:yes gene_type:complete